VNFLEKKQAKLTINISNTNDIIQLLGPASTKSTFDNDMWIYIERVKSSSKIFKLGKKELIRNNVLILEIDNKGILTQKIFINKEKMNDLQFSDDTIEMSMTKKSFIYEIYKNFPNITHNIFNRKFCIRSKKTDACMDFSSNG
jgi:outer membrane protein assembly factor BamE (lipoprotein component of BamABCDE complex)